MTIYIPQINTHSGARVINATTLSPINGVVRINTEQHTVEVVVYPLRVVGDEVVTRTMQFSRIDVVRHERLNIAAQFNCHE